MNTLATTSARSGLLKQCSAPSAFARPSLGCLAPARRAQIQHIQTRAQAAATGQVTPSPKVAQIPDSAEAAYLTDRANHVTKHFPNAMAVDDFIARVEIALFAHGFSGENSIACTNLCRDEATAVLKAKIDDVFGSSFNTNGLGGVLTCGVIGVNAGLSHAPIQASSGKERYVFFSCPHIAIDSVGEVGAITRPGRPGKSSACGAVIGALKTIKATGLSASAKPPGTHDPMDCEFSILHQRLARRLVSEGVTEEEVLEMSLVDLTKVAERTITNDLEQLISKAVDTSKADYAVVTGVQVHNWAASDDGSEPMLEFVAPAEVYVVVDGKRTDLNLFKIPSMTPRQIRLLAHQDVGAAEVDDVQQVYGTRIVSTVTGTWHRSMWPAGQPRMAGPPKAEPAPIATPGATAETTNGSSTSPSPQPPTTATVTASESKPAEEEKPAANVENADARLEQSQQV